MKKKIIIIIYFISCVIYTGKSQCINCGIFIDKFRVFDSTRNQWIKNGADTRIYYKDSIAIVPMPKFFTTEMNGILTDQHQEDLNYTFIDLHVKSYLKPNSFSKDSLYKKYVNNYKTATFYEYSAFSKDSFFTKKYSNLDTALKYVCCIFYLRYNDSYADSINTDYLKNFKDSTFFISDTVINSITYKRRKTFRFHKLNGIISSIHISYARCDTEDWMKLFVSDTDIDKQGCIFTRIDWKVPSLKQSWLSQDHEFFPGLTKEQMEVFNAWEKNAKLNPVRQ
jgi:hypothetical protein